LSPENPSAAPAVILLHGVPTSSYLWRNVQRRLAVKFKVLAPDLIGLGKSERGARVDVSLRSNAEMVCELMRLKGIPRAHVLAHDVGGGVAHILAADHREKIGKFVFMDVVAFKEDWPVPIVALLRTPVLGDLLSIFPAGPNLKFNLRKGVFHKARIRDGVWQHLYAPNRSYGDRRGFLRFIRAMDNRDVDDALHRWTGNAREDPLPTLILWGEADRFLPPRLGEKLCALIPGASLEIIEGAGHFIQEDVPEAIADRAAAFFSS
jgi:2-hydroxymuconate-semialdehyde hydrolase